jgi:putative tricarboxylic transport membrane protein
MKVPERQEGAEGVKKSEIAPALFWIGLSVLVMILALRLGLQDRTGVEKAGTPGPGLMPFLCGLSLLLVSLYLLAASLLRNRGEREPASKDQPKPDRGKIILVLAALLGYAFLLEPLGYLATTCLTLFLLFLRMGGRWGTAALASAATAAITYVIFTQLGVLLPEGIFTLQGVWR